jgi:hypothetical protein
MQLVHEPKQDECCNHALIPICHIPTTKIKTFRPFSYFLQRIEFPKSLRDLIQALPSLNHTHMIVGYGHKPNLYGILSLFATRRYQSFEFFDFDKPRKSTMV